MDKELPEERRLRKFNFFGFTLGKNGKGIYVRVHGKSWEKMGVIPAWEDALYIF